jgi:hypothetical protein
MSVMLNTRLSASAIRAGATTLLSVLLLALTSAPAPAASPLPYRAFGSGLDAGQLVEAYNGTTVVGRVIADHYGDWILDIAPSEAVDGDTITFSLDGARSKTSIVFHSGHFSPPPGIALRPGRTVVHPAPAAPSRSTPPRSVPPRTPARR